MLSAKIYQPQLIEGLSVVLKAVSGHGVLAILSNILLSFTEINLRLYATDLELGIETVVPAEESNVFDTTIPAKLFYDLISTMPGQLIHLEFNPDNSVMTVKGSKSSHEITCIPSNDFPKRITVDVEPMFTINTSVLKQTISRILFAASDEEDKPVLNSCIFSVSGESIVIYATDGFRASLRKILAETSVSSETQVIVPSSVVAEAAKIMSSDDTSFAFHESYVVIKSGRTTVYGQIISGKAPDYKLIQSLIDTIDAVSVTVSTAEFFLACKQADIFASRDEKKNLRIATDLTGVTISSTAQQVGKSTGHVNAIVLGSPLEMSISSMFLRQFLEAAKTPSVQVKMESSNRPFVVYIDEYPGYWHMIMPVAS